ncbi:MAG: carbamoyltransferase HypF [Phycisphaerae bacterium]|nr:carbamoyltransferase HypF [Phycisphaerae bacterium]
MATVNRPDIVDSHRAPVCLPAGQAVLALGGDLKSVVSLMQDDQVHSSKDFGDLADAGSYRHFAAAVEGFESRANGTHLTISHDLHPGYLSTSLAQKSRHTRMAVQHHHAHIASCLADNSQTGPVIGVACDGNGYGTNGAVWGCEVLVCDLWGFERVGHLGYFPLPGGDAAAKQTWRPALSLVRQAYGDDWASQTGDLFANIPAGDLATVEQMLKRNVNCVPTSSLGRLFDAVAFLLGLCDYNHTEAQAPIALEKSAEHEDASRALPFEVVSPQATGGDAGSAGGTRPTFATGMVIDVQSMIRMLVERMLGGSRPSELAADFHKTVVAMLATTVEMAAERTGIGKAALSGGCFFNRRLNHGLTKRLEHAGITVLRHKNIPMGDAGLSIGQAVIAAAEVTKETCV